VCDKCGKRYSVFERRYRCECGGLLHLELKRTDTSGIFLTRRRGVWRYRKLIPLPPKAPIITMGEGSTPLVRLKVLGKEAGLRSLFLKLEGSNPTGSFKDRGMTVAISFGKLIGVKKAVCASTGNTAASMSAYARRSGMEPFVVIPKGRVAGGKVSQLALYGARVLEVKGSFDDAIEKVLSIIEKDGSSYLLNSVNPWRIEGQKTVAFEIFEEYGVPDWIAVPVGNGGNIYSIWKGMKELKMLGMIEKLPRLLAIQAEGASPIADAIESGEFREVEEPRTLASAISIGRPVHWERAISAVRESGGSSVKVSDAEILNSQVLLARKEGVGVESASAAALAGLIKAVENKIVERGETAVLIGTGSALKEAEVLPIRFPLIREEVESSPEQQMVGGGEKQSA